MVATLYLCWGEAKLTRLRTLILFVFLQAMMSVATALYTAAFVYLRRKGRI